MSAVTNPEILRVRKYPQYRASKYRECSQYQCPQYINPKSCECTKYLQCFFSKIGASICAAFHRYSMRAQQVACLRGQIYRSCYFLVLQPGNDARLSTVQQYGLRLTAFAYIPSLPIEMRSVYRSCRRLRVLRSTGRYLLPCTRYPHVHENLWYCN